MLYSREWNHHGSKVLYRLGDITWGITGASGNSTEIIQKIIDAKIIEKNKLLKLILTASGHNGSNRITQRTYFGGRSEFLEVETEKVLQVVPEVKKFITEGTEDLVIGIKGTGPMTRSLTYTNIFDLKKKDTFNGFSGKDITDINLSMLGPIEFNEFPGYNYTPIRVILCYLQMLKIYNLNRTAFRDLKNLKEHLFVQVILERGGFDFAHLIQSKQNNKKLDLKEYFLKIMKNDEFLLNKITERGVNINSEWDNIITLLLSKHMMDSIVETKMHGCGGNRTLQNFCVLGFRDLDDTHMYTNIMENSINFDQALHSFGIKVDHLLKLFGTYFVKLNLGDILFNLLNYFKQAYPQNYDLISKIIVGCIFNADPLAFTKRFKLIKNSTFDIIFQEIMSSTSQESKLSVLEMIKANTLKIDFSSRIHVQNLIRSADKLTIKEM